MNQALRMPTRTALGFGTILLFLLAWQFLSPLIPGNAVATFTDSLEAAWNIVASPLLFTTVLPSLMRVVVGFLISAVLGIIIGSVLGSSPRLRPWVQPVIDFLRATPAPIIIPIAIALLGLGPELIIGVIVFGSIWPVLVNTTDAVSRVEPQYLDVAKIAHLKYVRTFVQVKLPASLPLIIPGLRLTMQLSLVLLVTAEMLGGSSGLGYQLILAQQTFDIAGTYGGILVLAIIGFLLDSIMVQLEKKYVRHGSNSGGTGA